MLSALILAMALTTQVELPPDPQDAFGPGAEGGVNLPWQADGEMPTEWAADSGLETLSPPPPVVELPQPPPAVVTAPPVRSDAPPAVAPRIVTPVPVQEQPRGPPAQHASLVEQQRLPDQPPPQTVRRSQSALYPATQHPIQRPNLQPAGQLAEDQPKRVYEFSAPRRDPNWVYEQCAILLSSMSKEQAYNVRMLSEWPYTDPQDIQEMDVALRFWLGHLALRRVTTPPQHIKGVGWVIDIADYGWDAQAWEKLVAQDPYFATTVVQYDKANGYEKVIRGWVSPGVAKAVNDVTYSQQPVCRADRFLAKTSIDTGNGGFYSAFMKLPGTEAQLFKQYGVDEKFLQDNALLRGGAVLGGYSIVALHNRELQMLPSPVGLDERYIWRSLDTATGVEKQSVLKNFLGTIKHDGKEYIGSNPNGTLWFYLANGKNDQAFEVPINIAQDKIDQYEARVITPYKCISCHTPQGGIRHFDDAISKMALHDDVGLAVITKGKYKDNDNDLKNALEDYYLSPLAQDITDHQESYTRVIKQLTGVSPDQAAAVYLKHVNRYLYGNVTKELAAAEFGIEQPLIDQYLKQTGSDELLALVAGETLTREIFEQAFPQGMRARIFSWERSPKYDVKAVIKKVPVYQKVDKPAYRSSGSDHRPRAADSKRRAVLHSASPAHSDVRRIVPLQGYSQAERRQTSVRRTSPVRGSGTQSVRRSTGRRPASRSTAFGAGR